jgi:hypothetical protein
MLHFNSAAAYPSNAVRLEPNPIPGQLGSNQGERLIAVHCNRSIFCAASPLWPYEVCKAGVLYHSRDPRRPTIIRLGEAKSPGTRLRDGGGVVSDGTCSARHTSCRLGRR